MRRFFHTLLLFSIVPALLFVILEIHARTSEAHFWFDGAATKIAENRVDFIFIGSSRVAAAVDADEFSTSLSKATHKSYRALNLGMGYSTAAEYYFGLKKLLRRNQYCLRDTTVLIEAPFGLPASDTWEDDWLQFPELPYHLSPYLEWADMLAYAKVQNAPSLNKGLVALGKLSAFSVRAFPYREKLLATLEQNTDRLQERWNIGTHRPSGEVDLKQDGGVRTDAQGVELVRKAALDCFNNSLHEQTQIDWERTIIKDFVKLVRVSGGKVVFFEIPVCSLQAKSLQTELRKQDAPSLAKHRVDWGFSTLKVDFICNDLDFPDLWHLRKSRSKDFSRSLAEAFYRDSCKEP